VGEDIFWFHSIDFGDAVSPGQKSLELLDTEWRQLRLPSLAGRSVLDIGAWDGYFSFRAEREGASRVVALDHYVWSLDLPAQQAYYRACKQAGAVPEPYHERPELWHPDSLPGMRAFSHARERLGSHVEPVVGDFMTTEVDPCDVVLFLGVLYHVEDPLLTMRRLRALTRELAVIETAATHVAGHDRPLFELFPSNELDGDVSNWWSPNEAGLHGLCRAAGFSNVETVARPPLDHLELVDGIARYRLVVHAS
jgi:tRNA (mo5U34)-methyltransferase